MRLDEEILGSEAGSISCEFRSRSDGSLFALRGDDGAGLEPRIVESSLVYEATVPGRWSELEAEDVRSLDDRRWHSAVVIVSSAGTRLYPDGYQVFCGTTTTFLKDLPDLAQAVVGQGGSPEVIAFTMHPRVLTSREAPALSKRAEPLAKVVADRLNPHDAAHFADARHGSFWLHFWVRGRVQQGALLAADGHGREQFIVSMGPEGIAYTAVSITGERRQVKATGARSDDGWHEVVVFVERGAVDLYVNGFRGTYTPGEFFLAGVERLDEVAVGQDCEGVCLSGEVQRAGFYGYTLSGTQIRRLSEVEPIETDVLLDRGYCGSVLYWTPSLLTLSSGTALAGADQRVSNVNDSPNDINLIVH